MKISKKVLMIVMISAIIAGSLGLLRASAEGVSMTDQQIELIRSSCLSTKSTLNQLHVSDALLRVNRGQIYESMSTKLMERFNSRTSNNRYNNSELVAATASYGQALDKFRLDYIDYEQQLSLAINADCSNQPVVFYDAVASARNKRNQVHADVSQLNQYIDQYQLALDKFEKDYQSATSGGK